VNYFAFDSEADDPTDRSQNQKIEEGLSGREVTGLHRQLKERNPA